MRKAKTSDAMEWIKAKLAAMAIREATPLPEPPPAAKVKAPNVTRIPKKPDIADVPCPDNVPLDEWETALRNVLYGSAPSQIGGSADVPSDALIDRMRRAAAAKPPAPRCLFHVPEPRPKQQIHCPNPASPRPSIRR